MPLDHPVVCEQLGDRDLYLGSARAAQPDVIDTDFAHVVTVSRVEQPLTTDFEPLVDGPGLDREAFVDAVDTARERHTDDGTVLVHCNAGISRSAAVIATVLACEEHHSLKDALTEIQQYRDRASPRTPLRNAAKHYLDNTPSAE